MLGALLLLLLMLGLLVVPIVAVVFVNHRQHHGPTEATKARITLAVIIGAVAVASIAFRWINNYGFQQSAALFIGIPAILAIGAVFSPTPRSAIGVACKAVTIGLLVSLIFLGEGMLCILMSAPLFYAVAIVVGWAAESLRRRSEAAGRKALSCIALLALVPMSLEGVTEGTSFARDVAVSQTRIVRAPADAVARALWAPPRFDRALPPYLAAGFPRPTATRIERAGGRARWVIRMRGGETRLNGMEPRAGDLVLVLESAAPDRIQWRAESDDSHMTHFLDWRRSRVEWQAIDAATTRVTWTIDYRRGLDPAWYFGPMEAYATRLAAGYLIDAVATP
jgi:hypothetical protein